MRHKVPSSAEVAELLTFQSYDPLPDIEGAWLKPLNTQDPDKGRLPWGAFGAGLWEEDRG